MFRAGSRPHRHRTAEVVISSGLERACSGASPAARRLPCDKQRVGAFIGTSLDQYLRQRGVTQVVLAGISTRVGVESTGRSAYDLGYNVAYVVDAITDVSAEAHGHSVERAFPRFGETATTEQVLALIGGPRT